MPIHCIVPPHILRHVVEHGDAEERAWAARTLVISKQFRDMRILSPAETAVIPDHRRTIYDARETEKLPGVVRRREGEPPTGDPAVDEAYDGLGATYDLYHEAFARHSIDNRGLRLDATVHYGHAYDNAFWNGRRMVFGDGDGRLFQRFTKAPDVIGHELTHGVTSYEAKLRYRGEPGALNESFSDVFGVLVKQRLLRVDARHASWLIGEGLFTAKVRGVALRSMKAPGTAYDDPVLGKDPQPASMKDYVWTEEDQGGVHINSGIPNRAFYELAAALGGFAWEAAAAIWYVALRDRLRETSTFARAAALTAQTAADLHGRGSLEQQAVVAAWRVVGVEMETTVAVAT